jgi:hypothetical protein
MKRLITSFLLCLALIGFSPIQNAAATGTLTQGDWSLVYPDFSKVGSDTEWNFEVKANGANQIFQTDVIWVEIFNSSEDQIGLGTYLQKSGSAKSAIVEVTLLEKKKLATSDLSKGLTVKLRIDRFRSLELKGGTFTFLVPTLNFPKRPTQNNQYIKLNSDFSKPLTFPEDCTKVPFSYTMNDPFEDIDQVNFDIIDSKGKSLAGAYSYGYRSETVQGELTLCDYSLSSATGPFQFQIELEFDSSLNKSPGIILSPFVVANKFAKVEGQIAAMPFVCQKGTTYRTSNGPCPSGFKLVNFGPLSTIQWNTLTRSAGSLKNKNFIVYGCVAQFDSNTGGSKFRAYTLPSPAERYYDGANSLFTGSAKALLKLSEDDAFAAKVTVSGATTYTTLGGRTSVPSFLIRDFVKIGTC